MQLVRGHRHGVDVDGVEVEGDLAVALDQVDVDVGVGADLPRQADELLDVAQGAELVVAVEDRHRAHVLAEVLEEGLRVHVAVLGDRQRDELWRERARSFSCARIAGWSVAAQRTRPGERFLTAP